MSNIFYAGEGQVIISARDGTFLVPSNDKYVGRSLIHYGEFSYGESVLFDKLAGKDQICWEIGANIGAHTVHLAKIFKEVIAFEPQGFCYRFLCANILINNCSNAKAYNIGLGEKKEYMYVPTFDTSGKFVNYGGVSLSNNEYTEKVAIFPGEYFISSDNTPDFLKIDVEGMELDVLKGFNLSSTYQPTIYLENDRRDKSEDLINYLWSKGYVLYWHTPPLFNPKNFNKQKDNLWPTVVSVNLLAVKNEISESLVKELKLIKVIENIHIMNLPKPAWV